MGNDPLSLYQPDYPWQEAKRVTAAQASTAINFFKSRRVAAAWLSWRDLTERRYAAAALLAKALSAARNPGLTRGLRGWKAEYARRVRLLALMRDAAVRVAFHERCRALRSWRDWLAVHKFNQERERRYRQTISRLRDPHLVRTFRAWAREWSLARGISTKLRWEGDRQSATAGICGFM